jgi:hypothetical protein
LKKILVALLILFVVLALGAAVFVATFDLNRFRPQIVEGASKALGTPIDIGRMSLVWRGGIAIRVQDLVVYSDPSKGSASAKVKELSAAVKLMPLLNKKIEVTSIVLQSPQVHVVKRADGKTGLKGVELPPSKNASSPSAAPTSTISGGAPPDLSVKSFQARSGAVWFEDVSQSPPLSVVVKEIDVDVKDFSLADAFSFRTKASLFSGSQNLDASGTLTLPMGANTGLFEDGVVKTDLSQLDLAEIEKALPSAKQAGIQEMRGVLETRIDRFDLGGKAAADADLSLADGRVRMRASKSALDNVQLKAALRGDDLRVETFTADYAGGRIKANGIVKQFRTQALSGFTWDSSDLALEQMMPDKGGNSPKLSGRLSLSMEAQAAGLSGPQVMRTLAGHGKLTLRDGVLLNYNLLRTLIEKLSMIPGAEGVIRDNLPNLYKAKMNEPSTILQPIEVQFAVQNGQLYFDRMDLVTDFIIISGSGQLGLEDKRLAARTIVRIHQQLSQHIVQLVPQAQILTNAQGEIEMPVTLQGTLPNVTPVPDPDYIAQKLLTSPAAQKVIQGFIENPEAALSQAGNLLDKPVQAGETGVQNSVAGLLRSAIGGDTE